MGKEATCVCEYAGSSFQVKAILEASELILRGELKKKILRSSISETSVSNGRLHFKTEGNRISLTLGEEQALKWQTVLHTPPPSLAQKLGITEGISVQLYGQIDDGNLHDALQMASRVSNKTGDLFIARINEIKDLNSVIITAKKNAKKKTPLWVIYPKGSKQPLSESDIRSLLRSNNLIDNKVTSVSPKLTGLRFVYKEEGSK